MASANDTETFQHYQVLKRPDGSLWELGRGAMGITYKAFDTNLRSEVALKVINALHLDSETARARFLREARAAAGLRHRNVASVYHLGNDDQSFFYAMEFVDGETVESLVKEVGPMPPVDALQIVVQIARALGAAAKQSLVHRDIKPANIMVTREDDEDEQFVVKVIDFGLARPSMGGEGSAHITMGGFVGTPQFASPEQLEEKDLDARSDIYSLGVTLWFMLAGRPPFTGPLGSVFIQQLTKEPPWAQLEGAPEPVLKLLAGMLQKEPEKRPQTPVELRRQVEACLRQLPAVERPLVPASLYDSEEADSVTGSETPATRSAVWSVGSVVAGRYELVEFAGEGTNGRVFRAKDTQQDGALVAIKLLHSDVLASPVERRRVEGEIEKLRNAPHPYLLEVHSLREDAETTFLVGEWLNGFTLVDLLRSRGQLALPDTLRLVAQAAVAADHAREHNFRRLELGLHQIMTSFEDVGGDQTDTRAALTASISQWPPFALKLDALGITREAGDSVTWAGDMTMMPGAPGLGRDTQTSIRGFVEGSDLFALGLITYELLSGAPPAHNQRGNGRETRYVALPALNEAANMVLRRALSPNPGFASNVDFLKALVDASGLPQTFIEESVAAGEADTFAVERLPVSGLGAEDAGATLILEDGESFPQTEPVTARMPSAEERARADAEAKRVEAERARAERAAAEKAAVERAEAQKVAAQRAAAERAERDRVQAEQEQARRVEAERLAAEQAEAKRVAAEKARAEQAEARRLAAEEAERERIEAERVEAERAEARRVEAEQREAQRLEDERIAAEHTEAERAEAERIAAERAEARRIEKAEADRIRAEQDEAKRVEAERIKAEKAEADRVRAEQAEIKRVEIERIKAEKAEADRRHAEQLKAERAEADRIKAEKAEADRVHAEQLKAERVEADRIKAEQTKAERAEADRLKAERAEAKRLEAERIKAEKAEAKRLQLEQAQAEKAAAEQRRLEAAQMRDVAGAGAVGYEAEEASAPSKIKGNKTVAFAAAGGVVLLAIVGVLIFAGGGSKPGPTVSKPTPAPQNQTNIEPDRPQESPAIANATPEPTAASSPEVGMNMEPSPGPQIIPEPTPAPTPAIAEATPAATPAPTPDSRGKQDEPDDRDDKRAAARAARLAEEKKQREADAEEARIAKKRDAETEANRIAARERDRDDKPKKIASTEPDRPKKTPVPQPPKKTVAEKPKPTPPPPNRKTDSFILR